MPSNLSYDYKPLYNGMHMHMQRTPELALRHWAIRVLRAKRRPSACHSHLDSPSEQ